MTVRFPMLLSACLCLCIGVGDACADFPQFLPLSEGLVESAVQGPLADTEEIVFCVRQIGKDGHWYANFGYWSSDPGRKMYGLGARLVKLHLRTGKVTPLLDDPAGSIRDPQVHYDAKKILFSYRPGGQENFHLYQIGVDGKGLRQLTDGPFNDIEPTYLPDGDILFVSSRCKRWVQCWHTQVAVLYRCGPDGKGIRQISANVEHDNTPWPLPDGRILYTRWEYVDRSQMRYHHLWSINPDGTGQMAFFGNMVGGMLMIDAKPIPHSRKVVAVFSPRHGRPGHMGDITLVDPRHGPDHQPSYRKLTRRGWYRDPYPLSEKLFLVAYDRFLVMMNDQGRMEPIYEVPGPRRGNYQEAMYAHEPRPIRPRPRQRVIPSRTDPSQATGTLVLSDITVGRNMTGVEPGQVRKLLVLESLPKPVNFSGGMDAVSAGGTFTIPRILGTVPVENDGSAHFRIPALRPVFFVALDENDLSVKRMQSFVSVMPGETTSCVGCHEPRSEAPANPGSSTPLALKRGPSRIQPLKDLPDILDFPRDIQPILNRHCVRCHKGAEAPKRLMLTGDSWSRYSNFSFAYLGLRKYVADGKNQDGNRPPRSIGSSASRLFKMLQAGHKDVKLSPREKKLIWLWIEAGAHYAGTYAALGSGDTGIDRERMDRILQRRCGGCHGYADTKGKFRLRFRTPYDDQWILDEPEKSAILLAPLSTQAGGWGRCKGKYVLFPGRDNQPKRHRDQPPVPEKQPPFADRKDPDYQAIRKLIAEASPWRRQFFMEGFVPNDHWIREMKRYGVLDSDYDTSQPIDVYQVERRYWRSLWYTPDP